MDNELSELESEEGFKRFIRYTINALDEYVQILNNSYDEKAGDNDPGNIELMKHTYEICGIVNNWLRLIDADEGELYEI